MRTTAAGRQAERSTGNDGCSSGEVITRTSRVWLDSEGIIQETDNAGSEQDLTDARENVAANVHVAQGVRRPLLVDMSQVKVIKREARAYYSNEGPRVASAVALVVGSPLSRMMGNFFLGFNKTKVPIRLFSSKENAAAWLRQFLPMGSDAKGGEA